MTKDLVGYSISTDGLAYIKSAAIYGHYKPNTIAPLVYLQKPKWVSDEDFKRIISSLKLELALMEKVDG
jgi:hypothetical protein